MLVALGAACGESPPRAATAARPLVVASVYPVYEFARQVAGDRAEVVALVPPGVEPHDWEPAPQDVARLEKARVFVFNGAGLEPWVAKLVGNLPAGGPVVVEASRGIDLLPADLPGHDEQAHQRGAPGGKPGDGKESGSRAVPHDPHVWLDPVLAQAQVEAIRSGLAQADPGNADAYDTNAGIFRGRLATLHAAFERGLDRCARRDLVVSHAAFGYLARRYRLSEVPVMGLAPESEPSAAEMAAIVRFAKRHHVEYIFFETLVSPRLAETLAREVGAKTLVLNPVEGLTPAEAAAGQGYVSLMEANLVNLRTALGCT
jgi:zinc transport system substrate-binding protein